MASSQPLSRRPLRGSFFGGAAVIAGLILASVLLANIWQGRSAVKASWTGSGLYVSTLSQHLVVLGFEHDANGLEAKAMLSKPRLSYGDQSQWYSLAELDHLVWQDKYGAHLAAPKPGEHIRVIYYFPESSTFQE